MAFSLRGGGYQTSASKTEPAILAVADFGPADWGEYQRRQRLDPFEIPDREFAGRYLFSKDGVRRLCDILHDEIEPKDGIEAIRSLLSKYCAVA